MGSIIGNNHTVFACEGFLYFSEKVQETRRASLFIKFRVCLLQEMILLYTVFLNVVVGRMQCDRFIDNWGHAEVGAVKANALAQGALPLSFLQRQVTKLPSGWFYRLSLLRNKKMATNLQRLTLNNGRRRFATCDC